MSLDLVIELEMLNRNELLTLKMYEFEALV